MAKTKKVTVSEYEKIIKESNPAVSITWRNLDISVKRILSISEAIEFTDVCAAVAFSGTESKYTPVLEDFAIRSATVEMFSNITLPEDISRKYTILYLSDIYDVIKENVCPAYYSMLVDSIHNKIDEIIQSRTVYLSEKIDSMISEIEKATHSLNSGIESMSEESINEIISFIKSPSITNPGAVGAILGDRHEQS